MSHLKQTITDKKENSVVVTKNGKKKIMTLPEFGEIVIKIQNNVPVTSFRTEREDF